jgi:hypothetical protein
MSSRPSFSGGDRLDQNAFCDLFADAEAGVADLADKVGVPAQKFDALLLAKAEFAQPVLHLWFGCELPDTYDHADLHPAQGAKFFAGAVAFDGGMDFFQLAQAV